MNTLLLIFSFIVFTGLIIYIGKQKSISDFYTNASKLEKKFFTLVIWAFALPLIIVASTGLFTFAGGLICFVGAAANFKRNKITNGAHMVGAYGGIIFGFVSMWLDFGFWPIGICFFVLSGLLYYFRSTITYIRYIEFVAFYLLIIGLTIAKL